VVLLADGISLRTTEGVTVVERHDLRKLFQIGELPCVIAHHGQNEIGALPVATLLTGSEFQQNQSRAWSRGLNVAMARCLAHLDPTVSQTLKSSPLRQVFGLWFAGFWPCTAGSEICELVWQSAGANRVRAALTTHEGLVIGGSGVKYIREYLRQPVNKTLDAANITRAPIDYSMTLLKELDQIATQRQEAAGETVFGGQRAMAVITRDGVDLGPLN